MRALTPGTISPPFGRYAHGVEVPPGARWVRTSGQLGQAADGAVPADIHDQAVICFDNIAAILATARMSAADIVHLSAYVTDRAHFPAFMRARDAFLAGVDRLPGSTLLIVGGFTRPEFLVEVEALAAAV